MSPVMRIALALVLTGSAAACPSAPPPPVHTPIPVASSTVEPVTAASAAPSSSASAAPRTATLLSDPEGWLSDFVAGPPGTMIVAGSGNKGAFVAQFDLAHGKQLARTKITDTQARTFIAREGDKVFLLVDDDGQHDVYDIGPNLAATHVARLHRPAAKKKSPDLFYESNAFVVVGGRFIVLPKGSPATPHVFSPTGTLIAERDCKAGLYWPMFYELELRGGRVVLSGLFYEDGSSGACAFDPDGKGPVDTLKIRAGEFFLAGDALALTGTDDHGPWFAPVDLHLKIGKKKQITETDKPTDSSDTSTCAGVSGTAVARVATIHGTKVVRTFNCCGATGPAGLWVCPQ